MKVKLWKWLIINNYKENIKMSNNYYFRNGGNDNIVDFEDAG